MLKLSEIVADHIAAQPQALQPALREIQAMFAKAYPQARVDLYGTAKGALPIYKDGDTWLGEFSARSKGTLVYLTDAEVVAKY